MRTNEGRGAGVGKHEERRAAGRRLARPARGEVCALAGWAARVQPPRPVLRYPLVAVPSVYVVRRLSSRSVCPRLVASLPGWLHGTERSGGTHAGDGGDGVRSERQVHGLGRLRGVRVPAWRGAGSNLTLCPRAVLTTCI
jgi:hypothetical protein